MQYSPERKEEQQKNVMPPLATLFNVVAGIPSLCGKGLMKIITSIVGHTSTIYLSN